MIKLITYSVLAAIVAFTSCSNKTKVSRKPVTRIEIIAEGQQIVYGSKLTVKLSSTVKNGKIKQVQVFFDNKLLSESKELISTITIDTKEYLPGNHSIKAKVIKEDGVEGYNYKSFFIASDIIPTELNFEVVKVINHNTKFFTQGLEFHNDFLYESTGDYGTSGIYKYIPESGKILKSVELDNKYFGEGITILNNKIFQLTYKSKKGFVYDLTSFEKLQEFTYKSTEGWGLTNDGTHLIMSDGTSKINYLDPNDFRIVKTIEVTTNSSVIQQINELEFVDGKIYANIWQSQFIIVIDAETGRVLHHIKLANLLSDVYAARVDVLNGIAYNRSEDAFYITGKLWPKMFKMKFYE